MKKVLSIILTISVFLTMLVILSLNAEAKKSGDFVYTINDGTAEITAYTGTATELDIPSTLDGYSVTSIGREAFRDCPSLTCVFISDSVTKIGFEAFYNCGSLNTIVIPDSVTTIDGWAFDDTAWINNQPNGLVYAGKVAYRIKGDYPSQIELNSDTLGIAEFAFKNCNTLTKIIVPDSVTNIGNYAFFECRALKDVTIGESVTSIGSYAFENCVALESISLGNSLDTIGHSAFSSCYSLESIDLPNSVSFIGSSAFYNCISLENITIYSYNTSIDADAFMNCDSLTIYGYKNSTAEIFANDYNIPYIPLDGEPPTQAPTEPTQKPLYGDVDGDGEVGVMDATFIQRYAAEMETPYPIGEPIE